MAKLDLCQPYQQPKNLRMHSATSAFEYLEVAESKKCKLRAGGLAGIGRQHGQQEPKQDARHTNDQQLSSVIISTTGGGIT